MPVYQQGKTSKEQNNRFTIIVIQMDPGYNEMVLLLHSRKGMIFLELRNFIILLVILNPKRQRHGDQGFQPLTSSPMSKAGFHQKQSKKQGFTWKIIYWGNVPRKTNRRVDNVRLRRKKAKQQYDIKQRATQRNKVSIPQDSSGDHVGDISQRYWKGVSAPE